MLVIKEFNYNVSKFEVDFFGDSKIDVYEEDELILEIEKIDDSIWIIQTSWIEDNLIPIKKELANELIKFIGIEINEKLGTELPIILHPNFFMIIDNSNLN